MRFYSYLILPVLYYIACCRGEVIKLRSFDVTQQVLMVKPSYSQSEPDQSSNEAQLQVLSKFPPAEVGIFDLYPGMGYLFNPLIFESQQIKDHRMFFLDTNPDADSFLRRSINDLNMQQAAAHAQPSSSSFKNQHAELFDLLKVLGRFDSSIRCLSSNETGHVDSNSIINICSSSGLAVSDYMISSAHNIIAKKNGITDDPNGLGPPPPKKPRRTQDDANSSADKLYRLVVFTRLKGREGIYLFLSNMRFRFNKATGSKWKHPKLQPLIQLELWRSARTNSVLEKEPEDRQWQVKTEPDILQSGMSYNFMLPPSTEYMLLDAMTDNPFHNWRNHASKKVNAILLQSGNQVALECASFKNNKQDSFTLTKVQDNVAGRLPRLSMFVLSICPESSLRIPEGLDVESGAVMILTWRNSSGSVSNVLISGDSQFMVGRPTTAFLRHQQAGTTRKRVEHLKQMLQDQLAAKVMYERMKIESTDDEHRANVIGEHMPKVQEPSNNYRKRPRK